MNKQAYYNMMKMASLLKAAENKKKPYSALDVDTSKNYYNWPVKKDPQIGYDPYDKGGYLRQLAELRGMVDKDAPHTNKDVKMYNEEYYKDINRLQKSYNDNVLPGAGLFERRGVDASRAAGRFSPQLSLPFRALNKAFRQSGDIKHKHWLKTNKVRPVSPDQITVPGFKDIFKAATPEQKKEIQYFLNTVAQNKGKGYGNVV